MASSDVDAGFLSCVKNWFLKAEYIVEDNWNVFIMKV